MLPTPDWAVESDQIAANLGFAVASAGDVNADGYADVIVGVHRWDDGKTDEGQARVYLGGPAGLPATADWNAVSGQDLAYFGYAVASAGDVNADGYDDVLVGARGWDGGELDEGQVRLYLGSAVGPSPTAAWTAESDQAGAYFGWSVAPAGDVNADGYADVLVGAYGWDSGQLNEGQARLYLGSAAGLALGPAWTAEPDQDGALSGWSVASAGDVNADGYDDVLVGTRDWDGGQHNEGRADLYLGGAAGLSTTAAWTAESDEINGRLGASVASAGDVNGDGYDDVIVGAYGWSDGQRREGQARVYLGEPAGLSPTAAWTVESDQIDAILGWSVASAGDVNGDGYADVLVGTYRWDGGETDEGRVSLYLGGAAGLSPTAAWTAESDQAYAELGGSVASAGDVNGDGLDDVLVGVTLYNGGELWEGRAALYQGVCETAGATFYADPDGDGLGDPAAPRAACVAPDGYVGNADDPCPLDPANACAAVHTGDTADSDADTDADSDADADSNADSDADADSDGCGCDASGRGGWGLPALAALVLRRRR